MTVNGRLVGFFWIPTAAMLGSLLCLLPAISAEAVDPKTVKSDPVLERGFRHTTEDRATAEVAIGKTNQLLGSLPDRLRPAWPGRAVGDGGIPVYLVASPQDAASTPAAVPRGCRCILVNPSLLTAWVKRHSTGPGRISVDRSDILTFMLLHEVGHIRDGTPAAAFANGTFIQLNIGPSLAKAGEERADDFASGLIRAQSRGTTPFEVSMTANWVAVALTYLSLNMQAYRSLDEFGAAATGKRSVFFDSGYSHPNLAWRILRSNHLIQQSSVTRELLDAFEDARKRGAENQPLYRKTD